MCAIGFENFVQRHLDIYNKGTTVRQNVQAITILKKIGEKNKHKFIANQAPQFILFNPWITLDELDKNLSYMQRYKICDMAILFTASTLRCFRGTSIYEKAKQEGFLTEKKWQFWVPWRFKDDDVAMVYRLLLKMRDIIIKDGSGYSIDDYRLYAMGKAETEAMRMMIRTIKENRGVSKYLLERICMRNILAMVDRYMAHYPPSDTKFLPDVV